MRGLIIFAVAFWASVSWACPEVQGKYTCIDQYEEFGLTIEKTEINGVEVLTIDGVKLFADGQWRPFDDGELRGRQRLQCIETAAEYSIVGDFINSDGAVYGQVDLVSQMSMTRSDNLVVRQTGSYTFDGDKQLINQTVFCQKK